jgi:hypothetical protein
MGSQRHALAVLPSGRVPNPLEETAWATGSVWTSLREEKSLDGKVEAKNTARKNSVRTNLLVQIAIHKFEGFLEKAVMDIHFFCFRGPVYFMTLSPCHEKKIT